MRFFRDKKPNTENDLRRLEMRLKATLQPVSPRTNFVRDLGAKLAEKEIIIGPKLILSKRVSNVLLIAGGVVGSVIMIITSIRGMISLISLVGMVYRFLNRDSKRQQPSLA